MLGKHTYLVVGLLVAAGAPYLSSLPEVQKHVAALALPSAAEPVKTESVFRFASADGEQTVSSPTANPFGGATAATAASTTQATTTSSTSGNLPTTMPTQSAAVLPQAGTARLVATSPATARPAHPAVDGSVPIRFEEVFRLDVNSAWLMTRWPRVTTGLADLELHGYRVSLVTGVREDDLAGALTYYYDKEQVIQKLTFRGVTGDPRRLVFFCTSGQNMEREIVDDPALQVYRNASTGRKSSELRVRPATVIRADAPRERFEVEMVLYR